MRWLVSGVVLVTLTGGTVWRQMPPISREELGSRLGVDRMKKADSYLSYGQHAFKNSRYTEAEFCLTDAEFEFSIALDFILPPDHYAAKHMREGIDKCRADIKEWGGDEDEKQVAEAW